MGLRCSLLGHDFGEPEVEREREERGSEVVLTVREVAECGRCGKTNVVSENKEVTALPDDADADHREDTEQTSLSDAAPESSTGEASEADEDVEEVEDVEDDAIIIGDDEDDGADEADEDGRAHGEWPEPDRPADEPEEERDGPVEWPTVETEDEGFDAQPSPGGSAAVEFGGGLAPERADVEEEEGIEYVESAESEPATAEVADADGGQAVEEADAGFAKVGEAPSPAEPGGGDVDTEFVCPQCGFVDDAIGSSLRAGDVCPDCRKGYLTEQER